MIEFSGSSAARAMSSASIGPNYTLYAFGGAVPTTLAEVPFNLLEAQPNNQLGYTTWQGLDYVSIYNNMLSKVKATSYRADDQRLDHILFQNVIGLNSLPKLSYFDISRQVFKHIPQTIASDLNQYSVYNGLNTLNDPANIADLFWDSDRGNNAHFAVPVENRNDGFFIEADFGYDADIESIIFVGDANNNFEGDMRIYTWDPALNAGAGDWVLFHTHTMVISSSNQDIVLPSSFTSSKVRMEFDQADQNSTSTEIAKIEFLGTEPASMPDFSGDITWGLFVPDSPRTSPFQDIVPIAMHALVTVGGPSENVEFKLAQKRGTPGRSNGILSAIFKFPSSEY